MSRDDRDHLLDALAGLSLPHSDTSRDAVVRARCHAAMARRRASTTVTDRLLLIAASVYGLVTILEAMRFVGTI